MPFSSASRRLFVPWSLPLADKAGEVHAVRAGDLGSGRGGQKIALVGVGLPLGHGGIVARGADLARPRGSASARTTCVGRLRRRRLLAVAVAVESVSHTGPRGGRGKIATLTAPLVRSAG